MEDNELKVYKYRCRDCKIIVETYLQTTNLIQVCENNAYRWWMSAVSDSEELFDEDYNSALTYIKSKTARRWFHRVYRKIKKTKYYR